MVGIDLQKIENSFGRIACPR